MSAAALRALLNSHVTSMFNTGTVDEYFQYLQSVEEDGSSAPGLVAEVINLFIGDANSILNGIAGLLRNQPVVDFNKVDDLVHQLKGCSCSVGAKKVNLCCMYFHQFIESRSKEGCLMALSLLRNEFCDVCNKFQTMMQLEQQIAACGPK
ncbi:histidine-containing phosphotransfer protein 2-like [Triticum dicoccoides]|uniref:histidine-containing phosphotransfer protein 2-like n=1 Tax=Triticum dicoccoides TaxID=85692 RepID=UPI00188EDC5D|nr:histidine-containing phosphotransfer protein 2-like [Triticum dicoccoides]